MKIRLIMGDTSDDGHGKTITICYDVNVSSYELKQAFIRGTDTLGVDLEEICSGYGDNILDNEDYEKLSKHIDVESIGFDIFEDEINIPHEAYAELWMRIAQVGDPSIKFELLHDTDDEIDIGGYGLFQ